MGRLLDKWNSTRFSFARRRGLWKVMWQLILFVFVALVILTILGVALPGASADAVFFVGLALILVLIGLVIAAEMLLVRKSRERSQWSRYLLFPFKAYVVIALPCVWILDPRMWAASLTGALGSIDLIYLIVGVLLTFVGLIQKLRYKSQAGVSTLAFGLLALCLAVFLLPALEVA